MIKNLSVLASRLKHHHDWVDFEYNKMTHLIIDTLEEASEEKVLTFAGKEDYQILDEYSFLHYESTKALILLRWQRDQMKKHLKENCELVDNLTQLVQPATQLELEKQHKFCLIRPSC